MEKGLFIRAFFLIFTYNLKASKTMITLSILLVLWGIYSTYKINKRCKQYDEIFHVFEGRFIDVIGFVLGLAVIVIGFISVCLYYLP